MEIEVEIEKYLFDKGYNTQKIRIGGSQCLIVSKAEVSATIWTDVKPWETFDNEGKIGMGYGTDNIDTVK